MQFDDERQVPLYRRRQPKNGGFIRKVKRNEVYNLVGCPLLPALLKIFNAHISVEYCSSVKVIKYIGNER